MAGAVLTAAVWWFVDAGSIDALEPLRRGAPRHAARYLNRLGGGLNPAMVVGYLTVAGIVFSRRRWWLYSMAMAAAGICAGVVVQLVKVFVNRGRPELWLGPNLFTESTSSSFPSGHAVGAFAMAGVLMFGSSSRITRLAALIVPVAIGLSRVVVFRHWPSDVVASAIIGLAFAWVFTRALFDVEQD